MVNGVAIANLPIVQLDSWYGLTFGQFYIYISRSGSIQAWGILEH
jgi:cobalt/nickel transport system permease protein